LNGTCLDNSFPDCVLKILDQSRMTYADFDREKEIMEYVNINIQWYWHPYLNQSTIIKTLDIITAYHI
jgi:hypothetical protein